MGRFGRLVVISGVTSGIGRALFCEFAKRGEGFRVAGCGRRYDRLQALRAEVASKKDGDGHLLAQVDVTSDAAVADWAASVVAAHGGPPSIVIANAGCNPIEAQRDAWEVSEDAFQRVMAVNVNGVANVGRAFVLAMVERGSGMFVAISSGSGRSTGAHKSAYLASKFAVEAYTKCMAHGFAERQPSMIAIPLAPGTSWHISYGILVMAY